MPAADRDVALAEAGLDVQLAVAKVSGLEEVLGGPDATRDALLAAWAPVVDQARTADTAAPVLGFRRGAGVASSFGEGLFGGLLIVGLGAGAAASAANPERSGPPESDTRGDFTMTGEQNRGELAGDIKHVDTATGVSTRLVTKVSVVPCPDADGRFEAQATMDVSTSKGGVGQRGVLEVELTGQVDDDAQLASSEIDYTMSWSRSGGGGEVLVDVAGSSETSPHITQATGGAADLEATAGFTSAVFAVIVQSSLERAAQQGWESGRCVRVDVTAQPGINDVRPGGTAEVTAAPRSKIDGGPTGGSVTATLEGIQAVEPNGSKVPADATFVYTAPTDDLPNHGTVKVEARSRRGVGKGEITFTIQRISYVASGAGKEITFSGSTAGSDVTVGFDVKGDFVGGSANFEFSGDIDAEGNRIPTGVVTITGGGSGATVTGTGTYTMTANQDGTLTVTMQTHSCVDVSGVCRDSQDVITLTPVS